MTHDEQAPRKRTERTCAGCQKHAESEELVRIVLDPESGALAIDLASSGFGRGAHVHATKDCIAKALKGGFARVFKTQVKGSVEELGAALVESADRRLEGLLIGARRAHQLVAGADSVRESLRTGKADIVVVACDAAAAIKLPEIEEAIASGRAFAWGDKPRLGALMLRQEVAVIAILHDGVADAIVRTYRMSGPFREKHRAVAGAETSKEAWSSSEVR